MTTKLEPIGVRKMYLLREGWGGGRTTPKQCGRAIQTLNMAELEKNMLCRQFWVLAGVCRESNRSYWLILRGISPHKLLVLVDVVTPDMVHHFSCFNGRFAKLL
jgi:hypothetical protein